MAFINFSSFLIKLARFSGIDYKILKENEMELLKALSCLGECYQFDNDLCVKALNGLGVEYFKAIGLNTADLQRDFKEKTYICLELNFNDIKGI